MKSLKAVTAVIGVMVLVVAVPAAAIAIDVMAGNDDQSTSATVTKMPMSSGMNAMSSTGGMMASGSTAAPVADELTIVHVQKGCHEWSNGNAQMPAMHLTMKPGQMLRVMNQDVDMHRMIELAGPQQMMMGGPMKQGQVDAIKFTKPGTYRFDTKVSPMKGMPEVETTGPDNVLRLTVTVA